MRFKFVVVCDGKIMRMAYMNNVNLAEISYIDAESELSNQFDLTICFDSGSYKVPNINGQLINEFIDKFDKVIYDHICDNDLIIVRIIRETVGDNYIGKDIEIYCIDEMINTAYNDITDTGRNKKKPSNNSNNATIDEKRNINMIMNKDENK